MALFPFTTVRLTLRPLRMADAPRVGSFANDPEIARYTANIPYPYPKGLAEVWIAETQRNFSSGTDYALAVAWRDTDALIGVIGLKIEDYAMGGELGYWIARPFWRRGLATEACRAMVVLAFNRMGLPKLWAGVRDGNEGSLKVLRNLGFVDRGEMDYNFPAHGRTRRVRLLCLDRIMARSQQERLGAAITHC